MAENGQTAVAWEMLSSVVVMRAKARENKLPKLLSSLHGVEVELARIIAGSDGAGANPKQIKGNATPAFSSASATGGNFDGFSDVGFELEPPVSPKRSSRRSGGGGRGDQQLRSYAKKYLNISRQLKDLLSYGEAIASGEDFGGALDYESETASDALLAEQHDLTFTISSLKASTFEGLVDKAAVLDDLIEENTDDPVQVLARSLARDIMAMGQSKK